MAIPGVYAVKTFAGYRQTAHEFAVWAGARGARWMADAKPLAWAYLQERADWGYSPSTLQKDRSALRKIFDDRGLTAGVALPVLSYKDAKRSRHPVANDKHFSEKKHQKEIIVAKAFGPRRFELEDFRPEDVFEARDGSLAVHIPHGKGNRPRVSQVRADMKEPLLQIINGLDPDQPVFDHIHKAMDVHDCRRDYSHVRQDEEVELDKQNGTQRPRKEIERVVSRDLGHNRTSVIRQHY